MVVHVAQAPASSLLTITNSLVPKKLPDLSCGSKNMMRTSNGRNCGGVQCKHLKRGFGRKHLRYMVRSSGSESAAILDPPTQMCDKHTRRSYRNITVNSDFVQAEQSNLRYQPVHSVSGIHADSENQCVSSVYCQYVKIGNGLYVPVRRPGGYLPNDWRRLIFCRTCGKEFFRGNKAASHPSFRGFMTSSQDSRNWSKSVQSQLSSYLVSDVWKARHWGLATCPFLLIIAFTENDFEAKKCLRNCFSFRD